MHFSGGDRAGWLLPGIAIAFEKRRPEKIGRTRFRSADFASAKFFPHRCPSVHLRPITRADRQCDGIIITQSIFSGGGRPIAATLTSLMQIVKANARTNCGQTETIQTHTSQPKCVRRRTDVATRNYSYLYVRTRPTFLARSSPAAFPSAVEALARGPRRRKEKREETRRRRPYLQTSGPRTHAFGRRRVKSPSSGISSPIVAGDDYDALLRRRSRVHRLRKETTQEAHATERPPASSSSSRLERERTSDGGGDASSFRRSRNANAAAERTHISGGGETATAAARFPSKKRRRRRRNNATRSIELSSRGGGELSVCRRR